MLDELPQEERKAREHTASMVTATNLALELGPRRAVGFVFGGLKGGFGKEVFFLGGEGFEGGRRPKSGHAKETEGYCGV